jgi:hypothetical protein
MRTSTIAGIALIIVLVCGAPNVISFGSNSPQILSRGDGVTSHLDVGYVVADNNLLDNETVVSLSLAGSSIVLLTASEKLFSSVCKFK